MQVRIHDLEAELWNIIREYAEDRAIPLKALPEVLRVIAAHAALAALDEIEAC